MENGSQLIRSFGEISSGLPLNIGKNKAMWLGKLANQKDKPLGFSVRQKKVEYPYKSEVDIQSLSLDS